MIPTSPAAKGIVPVATATVCRMTFSCGVNGFDMGKSLGKAEGRVLRSPKPTRADWRDIMATQPGVRFCYVARECISIDVGDGCLNLMVGFEQIEHETGDVPV